MQDLIKAIMKEGMCIKTLCIGKRLILEGLLRGLHKDKFTAEIKDDCIHVMSDYFGTSCIIDVQPDKIKFYPNPKVGFFSQTYIIQSCFETFLDDFSEVNEALMELEEDGIFVMPLSNEEFH